MIKAIGLIKRKPGLSREEFVKHYEEVHAPLALKYFPTIKRYVRNHIITPSGAEEPQFDCITEFWYDDMEGYQAVLNALGDHKTSWRSGQAPRCGNGRRVPMSLRGAQVARGSPRETVART